MLEKYAGKLKSAEELTRLVNEIGLIPLFDAGAGLFSVEALTPGQWWTGLKDDPWGWREEVADAGEIIYAKLFNGRAGFVSRQWYPKLANYRRNGYDFDSRWDEGLATPKCRDIMECVWKNGKRMTSEIKKEAGKPGFESALTQLQMQTYLVIAGFERKRDKYQNPYGWSIACMQTPEAAFGERFISEAYRETPEQSLAALMEHLKSILPEADEEAMTRILR